MSHIGVSLSLSLSTGRALVNNENQAHRLSGQLIKPCYTWGHHSEHSEQRCTANLFLTNAFILGLIKTLALCITVYDDKILNGCICQETLSNHFLRVCYYFFKLRKTKKTLFNINVYGQLIYSKLSVWFGRARRLLANSHFKR